MEWIYTFWQDFIRKEREHSKIHAESCTKGLFCVELMMGKAYFTVLVSFVLLSYLLRVEGAIRCTETKPLLRELPVGVSQLSECVLECTGMTYFKKLRLQDKRTIKFQICTEGQMLFCRRHVSSSISHILNVTFWLWHTISVWLMCMFDRALLLSAGFDCTLSFQETLVNIVGLGTWTAPSGKASSRPLCCYL